MLETKTPCSKAIDSKLPALVREFQSGDEYVLEQIIDVVKPIVKKYARKYAGFIPQDIEDLIQIGNIALVKALGDYNPSKNDSPRHFLSMCIERAFDSEAKYYSREKRMINRKCSSIESPLFISADGAEVFLEDIYVSTGMTTDEVVIQKESLLEIKSFKDKLKPRHKNIFILYFLLGYSQSDISKALNLEAKTLDNILYKMKKKFSKFVDEIKKERAVYLT